MEEMSEERRKLVARAMAVVFTKAARDELKSEEAQARLALALLQAALRWADRSGDERTIGVCTQNIAMVRGLLRSSES